MHNLLSKLSSASNKVVIEPREIFMGLPQKDVRYEYPRDVQTDVWRKWFEVRNNKNCIIKMNTGSGKTVVGLLILQSCLNEGKGPAAYVVPDKYLVSQVCEEAQKLGIRVTDNRDDYQYSENKSILVMPIHALVNGKSVFGMRQTGNYPLGSVLIDDVHACLDTITDQFSLKIPVEHDLYKQIISIFADRWKSYNPTSYTNIVELQDPIKRELIPSWMWQESANDVLRALKNFENNEDANQNIFFSLPLFEDNLAICNCIVTSRVIEILPYGISIEKIRSFAEAQRRIFMSATLSDDSVFITNIGLHENEIDTIITPNNANDLGDRLILFPKHLNSSISDEEIKNQIIETANSYNVVIIVPSKERARFWDPTGRLTVTRENINSAVSALKSRHIGMVVFVNRYDGIDLPNDACRMLVIDGLPPLKNEYEKYIQSIDSYSNILLREQVQRIEQGMGRGVRANSDSCCIILMGDHLADVLVRSKGIEYFSKATAEQYKLSKELWNLLKEENNNPSIEDIWSLSDYSLNREREWIQMSKERLAPVQYECVPNYDKISVGLRKAYECACLGQWKKAADEIDKIVNLDIPKATKGYLLQIKAAYTNFIDRALAQQIQLSAHSTNFSVLTPIEGMQYNKSTNNEHQAKNICIYANTITNDPNEFILFWNDVASNLAFSPDADGFEQAFESAGNILGFISTRPDKETNGAGPDNLWALGNGYYSIVECKSGAVSATISKDYCNQLGGSVRWFLSEYGNDCHYTPIIVHKSTVIDPLATPVDGMKIITPDCIEKLKRQISSFVSAMAQNNNWQDEERINNLLQQYRLRRQDFMQEYTVNYRTT